MQVGRLVANDFTGAMVKGALLDIDPTTGKKIDLVDVAHKLEEVRHKSHRSEIEEAEARLRLETSIETLRRDLDIEPQVAEAATAPELPEGATAAGRARNRAPAGPWPLAPDRDRARRPGEGCRRACR